MSFFKTTEQIRNSTKTVTRRLGWKFLIRRDRVMACVKCQGLKKGDKVEKIRPLLIIDVNREPLYKINNEDVLRSVIQTEVATSTNNSYSSCDCLHRHKRLVHIGDCF